MALGGGDGDLVGVLVGENDGGSVGGFVGRADGKSVGFAVGEEIGVVLRAPVNGGTDGCIDRDG